MLLHIIFLNAQIFFFIFFLFQIIKRMEVGEVTSSDLGPGTVVVGSDGELQYDLTPSANSFITNSQIVSQGETFES